MTSCQRCESSRIMSVGSHASDLHSWTRPDGKDGDGYLPYGLGIGGGDDLEIDYCLDCGQIQGEWPITEEAYKNAFEEDDEDDAAGIKFQDPANMKFEKPGPEPERSEAERAVINRFFRS